MMKFKRTVLWAVPLSFWYSQNNFYGWNWVPQSSGELFADGITLMLLMFALLGDQK